MKTRSNLEVVYVQNVYFMYYTNFINSIRYIIYKMTLTSVLNRKTVSISDETHKELVKLGVYGETIDDIIRKCIDAYKRQIKTRANLDDEEDSFGTKTAGPSY